MRVWILSKVLKVTTLSEYFCGGKINYGDFFFRKDSSCNIAVPKIARVAKLVDALSSGGSVREDVLVRIQSRALEKSVSH